MTREWQTLHQGATGLAWRLSNTLDVRLCVEALNEALAGRTPAEAYGAGLPADMMDEAHALPTYPPAQQQQQDVINRTLAARSDNGIQLNPANTLSNEPGPLHRIAESVPRTSHAAHCEDDMIIERLDHVVLTVTDMEKTIGFFVRVLGMQPIQFNDDRRGLVFGQQKINLHRADSPLKPHAARPTPGSADICLITSTPLPEVITQLADAGVSIEEGPVPRSGALGTIISVYVRDPDANLIEIAVYT